MRNRERNRFAFQEVFGNESDSGAYARFKSDKVHGITIYADEGMVANPAVPCKADFCCDVDRILSEVIPEMSNLVKFFKQYVMGIKSLTKQEETYYEQEIGKKLRERSIVPVVAYFRVIRRK